MGDAVQMDKAGILEIADHFVINKADYPGENNLKRELLDITAGRGVDHTVEVGGAGTLQRSMNATRFSGSIGIIGILTGGEVDPLAILRRSLRLQGIYVGSRRMFEDMNRALEAHEIHPLVDQTYAFDDARQAYHDMRAAQHFGKLVVTL